MKKLTRILCLALCLMMCLTLLPGTALAATTITKINCTLDAPKVGEKPATTATLPSSASTKIVRVEWEGDFAEDGTFQNLEAYRVIVTVTVKDPAKSQFVRMDGHKFTINGNLVDRVTWGSQTVVLRYRFPAIGATNTAREELEAGKTLLKAALDKLEPTVDITKEEFLAYCNSALEGNRTTLKLLDFKLEPPFKEGEKGSLFVNFGVECDLYEERLARGFTILSSSGNKRLLEEDGEAIQQAVSRMAATNSTTKEDVYNTAVAAVQHGTTVTWAEFSFNPATEEARGSLTGKFTLTLGDTTGSKYFLVYIPKLGQNVNVPKVTGLNAKEWEVVRYTNIIRKMHGQNLLTMPADLVAPCGVRASELNLSFSHTRPNGKAFRSAVMDEARTFYMGQGGLGENICQDSHANSTAAAIVEAWYRSEGHFANLIKSNYCYIGVGQDTHGWDQIFAIWNSDKITSVVSSTGSMSFDTVKAMENEYLICTSGSGIVSYLPLDADCMDQSGNTYTAYIANYGSVKLTVGTIEEPVEKPNTAYASNQEIILDGKKMDLKAYALKDENGYLTNYVRMRDIAYLLNGTKVQFNLGWDGKVNIETGKAYVADGSEMKTPFSGDRTYEFAPPNSTNINGDLSALTAIVLTDDNGGGYTYYKLRDVAEALNFYVGWNNGIVVDTTKPYSK